MTDMLYRSARKQLAALSERTISARELLDLHRVRNDAVHGKINAVVRQDEAAAVAAAQTIDDARARGEPLGPLAGLPMTIKDGFDVSGMPARAGNRAFQDRAPDCADAEMVARAKAAGAVIWGKTNVPFMLGDIQSYNDLDGTTNNPYDETRTPGGSSGGAAAALACGITPLEIGSDIGGSLRHPANFCGIVSLKPTHGLLPMRGHVPPPPGVDPEADLGVVGPMARNIGDLRLLFQVLSEAPVPSTTVAGARIAVWADEPRWPLSQDSAAAIERAAQALNAEGLMVVTTKPAIDAATLVDAYRVLLLTIIGADLPAKTRRQMNGIRPIAKLMSVFGKDLWSPWRNILGFTAKPAEIAAAGKAREAQKSAMKTFLDSHDAILMPISPGAAFPHDHVDLTRRTLGVDGKRVGYTNFLNWIAPATSLHNPSVAVQAGQTVGGLPIGVQLVGRWGEEARLLDLAEVIERRLGGFTPPSL